MKVEPFHSRSQNSNLFSALAGGKRARGIAPMLSRAAWVTMVLLGMVGCADLGDDNDLATTDEEATDEASQAIDAVAPIAPQDSDTTPVTVCASGCTYTNMPTTSTDHRNE